MFPKKGQVALAVAALAGFGCGSEMVVPDTEPAAAGQIVAKGIDLGSRLPGDSEMLTKIHIRAQGDDCGTIFSISSESQLWVRGREGKMRKGTVEDLQVSAQARGWSSLVFLSCPGQAAGEVIEVLEE